ncbi:hypothetical protein BDV98DRAFT_568186 [Pterulicium gracile]|uniref:MYND-type domain-containing protein n=1 Tax=Pterulicium gracile TaxID=1884261 RepID=A0A5C3QL88_9AGAR|nr:hypothetical protein BDV98DRAFT_568186 [Pterula gracilis]
MECIHSHFAQSHNIGPLSSPAGSSDPPQNTVSESAMTLLNLMGSLRGMKTCCAHFLFARRQPPQVSRCAKCMVVAYCSKECQRAAWSWPQLSHMLLCNYWARLHSVWAWDAKTLFITTAEQTTKDSANSPCTFDEHHEYLQKLAEGIGLDERMILGLCKATAQ